MEDRICTKCKVIKSERYGMIYRHIKDATHCKRCGACYFENGICKNEICESEAEIMRKELYQS